MATTTITPDGLVELGGSAPAVVTNAPGQVAPGIVIEWDFDNDGDFDEPDENITALVMSGESVTGRNYPSSLTGRAGAGQGRFTVLNTDDRFAYFNAASPLNTAPNSLRTGRKIRVRTVDAVADDPVLLARDRFNRSDGPLGTAETGQTWAPQASTFGVRNRVAAANAGTFTAAIIETIDVGTTDHYAQATIRQLPHVANRWTGLVVGFDDLNNYAFVVYDHGVASVGMAIYDVVAGVTSLAADYHLYGWEGMTIGAGLDNGVVTAYVGGVPVASAACSGPVGTNTGLYAVHPQHSGRSPEIGDFHVWDHVAGPVDGILWTGTVADISHGGHVGELKVATITADGIIGQAAGADVAAPRLARAGAATGLLVGDVMARAGLLHPPAPLDEGAITTGPVGVDDNDALELARMAEETERGFIHETNEGHIGYHGAQHRAAATSRAWFSDTPGVGQYPYSSLVPYDQKTQIVNRVTADVAADAPAGITTTYPAGTQHVDITLPTVAAGDLLVVFIAGSHAPTTDLWVTPLWWVAHREGLKQARGMRVYSHWCDGTESGTVVRFFNNPSAVAGLWIAAVVRVEDWYESYNSGVAMGEPARGNDAGPIVHGWGRAPTLFLVAQTGIGTTGTVIRFDPDNNPPDGYGGAAGNIVSSGVAATDAGVMTGYKIDCTDSEDPTAWVGLDAANVLESVVFAVRGYNGPHTKATLEDPRTTGGDGRSVTVEDVDSQDEHNVTRTNPTVPVLFATEADAEAYGDAVLSEFADDRPIIELTFPASSSAALRAQAIERRVGDKVTVTATGAAGLGVEADYFIEAIAHDWPDPKRWLCTWHLSPA